MSTWKTAVRGARFCIKFDTVDYYLHLPYYVLHFDSFANYCSTTVDAKKHNMDICTYSVLLQSLFHNYSIQISLGWVRGPVQPQSRMMAQTIPRLDTDAAATTPTTTWTTFFLPLFSFASSSSCLESSSWSTAPSSSMIWTVSSRPDDE